MLKEDKGFFDKKIVYLDYLERGEKVKNAGFVKWETRGAESRVQIHIRGLYPTDTLQGELQIVSGKNAYAADRIALQYGTGEFVAAWKNTDLSGSGISYEECDGIQIKISESRLLKAVWREREALMEVGAKQEPTTEIYAQKQTEEVGPESDIKQETGIPEEVSVEKETEIPEEVSAEQERKALVETSAKQELEAKPKASEEFVRESGRTKNELRAGQQEMKEEPSAEILSKDKWEQLGKLYPRIHPFGDGREYLSIAPRDFVILPGKYQGLVQNSFLLHGYYNYGHVALAKIKEDAEESFYLGVPGVYYEREKQAARMFGFEGFEAGKENVPEGGFGYYMKRVEI